MLLLSPTEAAAALGIGRWKLYDLMRKGLLRWIKIDGCRRDPHLSPGGVRGHHDRRAVRPVALTVEESPNGRANGEGSVYPKGDGFEAALIVHGRRRTARAKTVTEARAKPSPAPASAGARTSVV